jgi:hypothetical protein
VAVVVVDPERFEIRAKRSEEPTLAGFIERSKKYQGAAEGLDFGRVKMPFRDKSREIFDEDFFDKDET